MSWVCLLLAGIPFHYFYPWYEQIQLVVVSTTITSQILFLGCPLSTLEWKLRQDENFGSLTSYLLERAGIDLNATVVSVSLLLIVATWTAVVALS
jgi:hypothetical protein